MGHVSSVAEAELPEARRWWDVRRGRKLLVITLRSSSGFAPNVWATALAAVPLGAAIGVLQVSGMAWLTS